MAIRAFIYVICLKILMIGYSCNKKTKFLRDFLTKNDKTDKVYMGKYAGIVGVGVFLIKALMNEVEYGSNLVGGTQVKDD